MKGHPVSGRLRGPGDREDGHPNDRPTITYRKIEQRRPRVTVKGLLASACRHRRYRNTTPLSGPLFVTGDALEPPVLKDQRSQDPW